jgi:hypothetical protein
VSDVRRASSRTLGFALAAILAGCARVPEHYELPQLEVHQSDFAATLAVYTGTGVVGGNRVEILLNGDEIFPSTLAVVRGARRNINFAQSFYENGPPATELAEAFAERCRTGVEVTCGPAQLVGIHWGTFALGREPYDEPPRRDRRPPTVFPAIGVI